MRAPSSSQGYLRGGDPHCRLPPLVHKDCAELVLGFVRTHQSPKPYLAGINIVGEGPKGQLALWNPGWEEQASELPSPTPGLAAVQKSESVN